MPPANTETLVTPPPSSTRATPSSRSSSLRHALPAATGEATIASTPRWAERTHRIQILHRRRIGGDDVDVDGELVGVEAARLLDALDPVDRVERRNGVEDGAALGIDRLPAGVEQSVDILGRDAAAADRDLDPGDVADQPAGGKADEHLVDLGAGDALGLLDRLADRDLALLHVGDEAALDAAAFALAGAEDAQFAVLARLGDQGADLRRADVERRDQIAGRRLGRAAHHQMVLDRSCGGWPGSGVAAGGTLAPGSREMRT